MLWTFTSKCLSPILIQRSVNWPVCWPNPACCLFVVSLERSHVHVFTHVVYGRFCTTVGELHSCNRDQLLPGPLQKKVPNPIVTRIFLCITTMQWWNQGNSKLIQYFIWHIVHIQILSVPSTVTSFSFAWLFPYDQIQVKWFRQDVCISGDGSSFVHLIGRHVMLICPIIDDANVDYLVKMISVSFLSAKVIFSSFLINMYFEGRYFETLNTWFSNICIQWDVATTGNSRQNKLRP